MAEPTPSNLPLDYDDASSLSGALLTRANFTLYEDISSGSTTFYVAGPALQLDLPAYLTFGVSGSIPAELILVTATPSGSTVTVERGCHDTVASDRPAGDYLWQPLAAQHMIFYRQALLATERYRARQKTRAAAGTPDDGEVVIDSGVWFGVGDAWWKQGITDHGDFPDVATSDDHTQYHTPSRALTYHDGLSGLHVTSGSSHDHTVSGSWAGIERVRGGPTGSKPSPSQSGEVYFDTTVDTFYLASGSSWSELANVPAGMIAVFTEYWVHTVYGDDCPPGWSRFTDLDDLYVVGGSSPTGMGNVGSDDHYHVYTATPLHKHGAQASVSTTDYGGGSHSHTVYGSGGSGDGGCDYIDGQQKVDYVGYADHTHSGTMPATVTNLTKDTGANTMDGTANTSTDDTRPPSSVVVFCVKD